jgi:hypothetical protein
MRDAHDAHTRKLIEGLRQRRWTASDAEQALEAWRRTSLSAREFCRIYGMDPQRLLWWNRRSVKGKAQRRRTSRLVPAVVTMSSQPAGVIVRVGEIAIAVDAAAVQAEWVAVLLRELTEK